MGRTLMRLIITVAPQKDICPHGKTYPRNAAPILSTINNHPEIQVSFNLKEEFINPRLK